MSDVAQYRHEAERCRSLAAQATDPIEKHALHRMADEWLRLAQSSMMHKPNANGAIIRANAVDP
jgi:hypothetical protein